MTSAKIVGLGKYLPSKCLTNLHIEKMVDTSDEWITTRTGIKERRIAKKHQASSDLAYEASKIALKRAGIKVSSGILKKEAMLQNDIFFGYHSNKKPYIITKSAQTLDGRIATVTGDSKWISSDTSLRFAHRLRSVLHETSGCCRDQKSVRSN